MLLLLFYYFRLLSPKYYPQNLIIDSILSGINKLGTVMISKKNSQTK
jgi:hypothetical protein